MVHLPYIIKNDINGIFTYALNNKRTTTGRPIFRNVRKRRVIGKQIPIHFHKNLHELANVRTPINIHDINSVIAQSKHR